MTASPGRILLLMPTTTYRAQPFLDAAQKLGVEVLIGSDRCHQLAEIWPIPSLALDLKQPDLAAERIAAEAQLRPFDALVPVDDGGTLVAAAAARRLGLPFNAPEAAARARNKLLMRQALAEAGVPQPDFQVYTLQQAPESIAHQTNFPCVLKPLLLSGSRGVIRADDIPSFCKAWQRISDLLRLPEVAHAAGDAGRCILVEDFIPGIEVALEGLLVDGELRTLAVFDKPDPLDGPFFEETLYVTPSRLPTAVQEGLRKASEAAALALGLGQGPIHAELRINDQGLWLIELAARSIGGQCSRILRFGVDCSLEELILRQTLGLELPPSARQSTAAGVLMLPIPAAGWLRGVQGQAEALDVPGIEDLDITAKLGQRIVPLPEGASYLGFLFARGATPEAVVQSLKTAHARLVFEIEPELPVLAS